MNIEDRRAAARDEIDRLLASRSQAADARHSNKDELERQAAALKAQQQLVKADDRLVNSIDRRIFKRLRRYRKLLFSQGKKSLTLVHGTVGWRTGNPQLQLLADNQEIFKTLKRWHIFSKYTTQAEPTIKTTALRIDLDRSSKLRERLEGLATVAQYDRPYIDTKKTIPSTGERSTSSKKRVIRH